MSEPFEFMVTLSPRAKQWAAIVKRSSRSRGSPVPKLTVITPASARMSATRIASPVSNSSDLSRREKQWLHTKLHRAVRPQLTISGEER